MVAQQTKGRTQGRHDLVIERVFDAPRALVWKAWTDPEHLRRWWGPQYFTSPACRVDLRVGGTYLFCMRSPDGHDFWSAGVYREIVEPERIVYTDSFADADGNIVPASYYGMPGDFPLEMLVTVTFEEHNGKTKMTLRHAGLPEGGLEETGWRQSFDKLAESLKVGQDDEAPAARIKLIAEPGKQEIVITRDFDAPRDLVFKTYTDPKLIPQWWGPSYLTTTVEQMDVRKGGIWRFVQRDQQGNVFAFNGVYHEINPPARLVFTFEFEGTAGHILLETVTLEAHGGQTRMIDQSVFQSVKDRDSMLSAGMEGGAAESVERFAKLLAKAQQ